MCRHLVTVGYETAEVDDALHAEVACRLSDIARCRTVAVGEIGLPDAVYEVVDRIDRLPVRARGVEGGAHRVGVVDVHVDGAHLVSPSVLRQSLR